MQKSFARSFAILILLSNAFLGGASIALADGAAPAPSPLPSAAASQRKAAAPVSAAPASAPAPEPAASAAPNTIAILGGTPVTVQLVDKVSSGTATVGDTFAVEASNDVIVDGLVAISKGAGGQGEVLSVDRAGSHGHAGSLGIQIDWLYAVDGEKVRLSSQRKSEEGENKAGVSSTMTIVSWAFLGLPGLFVHNWVKGHEIELDGSRAIQAYVSDTVHVVSTMKADAEAGFAH
jgi:nucleoid-associated protein YgaU